MQNPERVCFVLLLSTVAVSIKANGPSRSLPATPSSGLAYYEPNVSRIACPVYADAETPAKFIPPLQKKGDLANLLELEGLTRGAEVGVQMGNFAAEMLSRWKSCTSYLLVDLWAHQANYFDKANVKTGTQLQFKQVALNKLKPYEGKLHVCHNFSTVCANTIPDASLDFVYVDARHDYKGALEDLKHYWPKLVRGGIMAGHDYLYSAEVPHSDYSQNGDGSRDPAGRAAKGAVDDFFTQCVRRQVVVTYRERTTTAVSWMVRK